MIIRRLNDWRSFLKSNGRMFVIFGACLILFTGLWFFGDRLVKPAPSPDEQRKAEYLARKKAEAREMIVGQPLESTPPPGNEQSNFYAVRLEAGEYIRLTVNGALSPYEYAVIYLVLLDPQDKAVAVSDESFNVSVSAVAETAGLYHIQVYRYSSVKSPHRILLSERRRADSQDMIRAAAYRALTEAYQIQQGELLSSKDPAEKALLKYEEALKLVRSINDRREEVFVLNQIARVYSFIHDSARFADYNQQALSALCIVQDRECVRATADKLSRNTTDRQLAVDNSLRFAEMAGEDGDLLLKANTLRRIGGIYAEEHIAGVYENARIPEDAQHALDAYQLALTVQRALSAQLANEPNASLDSLLIFYSKRDEAEILLKMGELQKRLGQNTAALESCRQALELARECKIKLGERELTSKLVESDALKLIDQIRSTKTKPIRK